ncbi:MAG: tRNA uridine-5-carboxymethylaminomethyl(34) synthesis GTPase MnmE [Acidobacteria bacterium]|nr:tRNA uridine-5-carboxymethylaminomethyl(34) synthesis GTPase MnmE [Acidobacteriota bacterium]MCA1642698.1 tRNA uridine-5-carboxymethylaminomethyl(34) synthesis GTPase MnmE [Acidobacteriota bacterium]
MQSSDTIVALSTPPGRSGIGVIRLSGDDSLDYVRSLLRDEQFAPDPHRVTLRTLRDTDRDETLDQALLTYFKAPHSFTGEDIVELSCHGSPVILLRVIDALLHLGARVANPGEFTLRALSNGRMNLTQAEAVRDLIDAQTHAAARQAARQLGGELSSRIQPVKDALIKIIVPLESAIEFVEDDLPDVAIAKIGLQLQGLTRNLEALANTFRAGRLLKEGLKVALIGRPNAGKSSLFNRLLSSERAIVTDIPGTTRDSLSEVLNIKGVPVLLTDTAGMRESEDPIEHLGIERTRRAVADADLIVVVVDGAQPLSADDEAILAEVFDAKHLIALNKSDLVNFGAARLNGASRHLDSLPVSAKTGAGLEELQHAILRPFDAGNEHDEDFLITSARHFDLLRRATGALHSSGGVLHHKASEDLILVGLYDALRFLDEITGETTPEDVLSEIFATFCIGK